MKPTIANLECAEVVLRRNHLDPKTWASLKRDIALAITLAEREAYRKQEASRRGEGK